MNCTHAREAILLAQSGELPDGQQPGLTAHLAECGTCRAYQTDLARMTTAARNTPLEAMVSELTLRRIEIAAARRHGARRPGRLIELWRPALTIGAAASLILLLAVSYLQRHSTEVARTAQPAANPDTPAEWLAWDPDIDEEVDSLNTLLVMAVDDTGSQENSESLDSLAEELLELESWSI